MTPRDRHTVRRSAVGLLALSGLALAGCGGEEDTGTEVEDITAGEVVGSSPTPQEDGAVPTAEGPGTESIVADPYRGAYNREFYDDRAVHEGQEVTLSAEVEEVVSSHALEIGDPEDVTLDPLLVVHGPGVGGLEEGRAVEIVGTVQASFDLATAEEDLGVDLEDQLFIDHHGDPYLRATEVTPER